MIKHSQTYDRHSTVSLEEGLAAIASVVAAIRARQKPSKVQLNGQLVNAKSLRLQTFLVKGTVCSCCGIKGTHFALERGVAEKTYHLNLWATDEHGDEYLMTHDHILARSLGGADNISNTQTMCSPCNAAKAVEELKELRERQA